MAFAHHPSQTVVQHRTSSNYPAAASSLTFRDKRTHDAPVESLEVIVRWGDYIISVAHHFPPRDVTLGETLPDGRPCDVLLPQERLGFDAFPLIRVDGSDTLLTIPASAEGLFTDADGSTTSLERMRLELPVHPVIAGAHSVVLRHQQRALIRIGAFEIAVSAIAKVERQSRDLASLLDSRFLSVFGLTLCTVGVFLGSLGYYVPDMNLINDDELNDEQARTIQQYLVTIAERNLPAPEIPTDTGAQAGERNGQSGSRSRGEEGKTGSTTSRKIEGRMAIQGSASNADTHLGRAAMLEEARNFGMVELLGTLNSSDRRAMSSPFGHDVAVGKDAVDAIGQLYGQSIGDSAGMGGLALSGTGLGGGCTGPNCGAGVGISNIGTIGGGQGNCDGVDGPCDGMGRSRGIGRRGHTSRAPRVRMPPNIELSGRLPPEVIQRIVRQNYGRFRFCYEQGLVRNPNLEGRVTTRFIIGRDGAVSNVQNGGSDLPDAGVQSCIVQSFYGLSFPAPENGVVTVSYPISLQPG